MQSNRAMKTETRKRNCARECSGRIWLESEGAEGEGPRVNVSSTVWSSETGRWPMSEGDEVGE
jgi:hypothetical protein